MRRGFTVIELLVTIAIVGIISSYIATSVSESRKKAQYTKVYLEAQELYTALTMHMVSNGSYPTLEECYDTVSLNYSSYRNTTGETLYYYPVITGFTAPGRCTTREASSSVPTAAHVLKELNDEGLLKSDLKVPAGVLASYGLMTVNPVGTLWYYCGDQPIQKNKPVIILTVPQADAKYFPANARTRKVQNTSTGVFTTIPYVFCFYVD